MLLVLFTVTVLCTDCLVLGDVLVLVIVADCL